MSTTQVRLDARAFFWRVAVAVFLVRQAIVWMWIPRVPFRHPMMRLLILIFSPRGTQRSIYYAVAAASIATIIAGLIVRVLVRPLVARWHTPQVDDTEAQFHLAPGEWMVESSPARRAAGRSWEPGTLVRTNRRLGFYPTRWLAEPWVCSLDSIVDARLRPAASDRWRLLCDWPDRFEVRTRSEAPEVFVVPDPEAVISWFHPPQLALSPTPVGTEHW
jgi:hypothetical protein